VRLLLVAAVVLVPPALVAVAIWRIMSDADDFIGADWGTDDDALWELWGDE
jgi:hypothetical protein